MWEKGYLVLSAISNVCGKPWNLEHIPCGKFKQFLFFLTNACVFKKKVRNKKLQTKKQTDVE